MKIPEVSKVIITVRKWRKSKRGTPYETVREEIEGHGLLEEGVSELAKLICGLGTPTAWDNANARLGVGDSNAAFNVAQTGLQGTSKTFKAMDTGYPQEGALADRKTIWRATFGDTEGNHAWEEFTVVNAADDTGDNLNREVTSKGTKSGGTWELTLEIVWS